MRKYVTQFEVFGIIVMINRYKHGIHEKYKDKIIERDSLYVDGSCHEESFPGSIFHFFKSKHNLMSGDEKTITIYHIILNVRSLFE